MIHTKIVLPRRPANLLTRPRLQHLLDEIPNYGLTLICAPAGYGKTSALVDWAHQSKLPVCWYTMDELDTDLEQFLAYLITSLSQRFPEFGAASSAVLLSTSRERKEERLLQVLVNDIHAHIDDDFALILDDFHLADESDEIIDFLDGFVKHMGDKCHLVLSSRKISHLPSLILLTARSQVVGIGQEDLAFSPEELQLLILRNWGRTLSETDATDLIRETDGWITGLLLSAHDKLYGMADRVRAARLAGVGLFDYLAEEIFAQQPPELQDFLLRSSLLESFNVKLCQKVLGADKDWVPLVDAVMRHNLFVQITDDQGFWLRYQRLFQDFLQQRLSRERPEEYSAILQRLVDVYISRAQWLKAYRTQRRLNDTEGLLRLIECCGSSLIRTGRPNLLGQWLDALSPKLLSKRPLLLSLCGVVASQRGEVQKGQSLQSEAIHGLLGLA